MQKVVRTVYEDGSVVLSNIRNDKGFPIFKENETVSATRVTKWYDGTDMDSTKVDGKVYLRDRELNEYYLLNLPNHGNSFLEKDTMSDMRSISNTEILLLKMGYYKGITLNGYYKKGDTPNSINYIINNSILNKDDDGGSIIKINDILLYHEFKDSVDIRYFGAIYDSVTNNTPFITNCANLKLPIIIPKIDDINYYMIGGKIRIYNSVFGVGTPKLKVTNDVNSFEPPVNYKYGKYSIFHVGIKNDNSYLEISGLDLDGSWDGVYRGSEQEACIVVSESKNVTIKNNIISNAVGDGITVSWYNQELPKWTVPYCENITIENNIINNPYRCNIAVISGKNINIINNVIYKPFDYVSPIDLEMDVWDTKGLIIENINVHNNIIDTPNCEIAISTLGMLDGVNGVSICNNKIIAKDQAIRFISGYGHIKNIEICNNMVDCNLAINFGGGTYGASNVIIKNIKHINKDGIYRLASVSTISNLTIDSCECTTNSETFCIVIGSNSKDLYIKNNKLNSIDYTGILLSGTIENVFISSNIIEGKLNLIKLETHGGVPKYNNISIMSNEFISNYLNQVAVGLQHVVTNLTITPDNIYTNLIGSCSNTELATFTDVATNDTMPLYARIGETIFNSDTKSFHIWYDNKWNRTKGNKVDDLATETSGEYPSKDEFNNLFTELRHIKNSLMQAGVIES